MNVKHSAITLVMAGIVAVFSGCSVINGSIQSNTPLPTAIKTETATPEVIATPEATIPEPTEIIPETDVYKSTGLDLAFTIPASWVGKYRVEEEDGCLTVLFTPEKPIGENSWSGELFSIARETSEAGKNINGEWEFISGGLAYIWGVFDDMPYDEGESEYDKFSAMQKDVPSIFKTLQSVAGQAIIDAKRLWIEVIPVNAEYTTTMGLGIAFTLPKSWVGKCRIVESEDCISFYFHPAKPFNANTGDGFFFCILRKTADNDADYLDSVREFKINGVTYISGTSTDVPYSEDQPEYDTYMAMGGDRQDILDTVKASK